MEIWLFFKAVAHHWQQLMTGGIIWALSPVYERQTGQQIPAWLFWPLVSFFVFWAVFLAWRDEHRARIAQGGPQLILSCVEERDPKPYRWFVRNSGDRDAVNITCDEIASYEARAVIKVPQMVKVGDEANVEFRQYTGDESKGNRRHFGTSPHPGILIDAVKKGADDGPGDPREYLEAIAELAIPVRLTYQDASGTRYARECEIRWNHVRHKGHVHHGAAGPLISRSRSESKAEGLRA